MARKWLPMLSAIKEYLLQPMHLSTMASNIGSIKTSPSSGEETKSIKYSRLNSGGDTLTTTFSYTILGIKYHGLTENRIGASNC